MAGLGSSPVGRHGNARAHADFFLPQSETHKKVGFQINYVTFLKLSLYTSMYCLRAPELLYE